MEPLSSGPILASYFASKNHHDRAHRRVDDREIVDVDSPARHALIARARQASGAVLISLGERLAGAPRTASGTVTGTTP